MASVKFYADKERKNGCLILLTFTFNNLRLRLSTGLNIPKNSWNAEEQKAKPLKDFSETNKRLREINNFLLDTYDEMFKKGMKIPREEIKKKGLEIREKYQIFLGRKEVAISNQISLAAFIPIFQSKYKNKHNPNFLQHFNATKTHLENYQEKTGSIVTFEEVTKTFYISFTDYLKEQNLKINTIGSHIKRIKRLMNEANEERLTENQEHRSIGFKVLKEDTDSIYLTEDEIDALYHLQIDDKRMRKIRDLFVLNCHTGLRHSDWSKVTLKNIEDGKLYVKTQKTKETVIIPVHPIIPEILNRYGPDLKIPTNQEANRVIKWIGEYAVLMKITNGNPDKWLQIRTHTARRSFATNAYINGVPLLSIMQITGHKTTQNFMKYIRISKLENAMKLMNHPFFNA